MACARKIALGVSMFGMLLVSVLGAGCSVEADDGDDLADEEDTEIVSQTEDELVDQTAGGCASQCRPDNCVGYARCRTQRDNVGGTLPTGLTTFGDKLAVARHATGRRGCVAMIRTSRVYGHAAYVEASWLDGGVRRYRISEASWAHQYSCGRRSGSKSALGIAEFWCPR